MQIDELLTGEQTQNPDLDMNQVVGTHDILMLCFDTLRYDVSKEEEEAGRTTGTEQSPEENGKKDMHREILLTRLICHLCRISAFSGGTSFATQP